jgi:adenylate kinase
MRALLDTNIVIHREAAIAVPVDVAVFDQISPDVFNPLKDYPKKILARLKELFTNNLDKHVVMISERFLSNSRKSY